MFAAAGILDVPIDGQQTVAYLVRRTQAFDLEHNAKTSLGFVFNKACDKLCHMKTVRNEDVVEARKQLGLPSLVVKSPGITEYDLKHTDRRRLKMLHNDRMRDNRMDSVHTRDLQNAVVRHHQNNPHVSMEAAFEYIMSISSTYRALPAACIAKARRYLALPVSDPDQALQHLSDNDLFPIFLIPIGKPDSEGATPLRWERIIFDDPADTLEASDELNPGTTVVHAERVVVDNKKMIKILKFENVQLLSNLPNKYTAKTPIYCWFRSGIELKHFDMPYTIHQNVLPSDILSLKDFGQMIKTMKAAATRLSKINKTAKLEKEHSGKFTVSI